MEIDPQKLHWRDAYKLMIGAVTPRPIALVTTVGPEGPNAAPFSFFNCLGAQPAMVAISVGDEDGREKDTVRNIRHCPEFVVHIVSEQIAEQMNICATDYPPQINEILEAGFTPLPSVRVKPPRLAEPPFALECRLMQMLDLGQQKYHLIIGEVVYIHCHDGLVDEKWHVDVAKVNPIGRLAGSSWYTRVTDRLEIRRRKYRDLIGPKQD